VQCIAREGVSHLQAEQAEALLVICFEVLAQGSACLKAGLRFTQGTSYLSHGLQLPVQGLPTKRCWLDEGMLAASGSSSMKLGKGFLQPMMNTCKEADDIRHSYAGNTRQYMLAMD